MKRLSKLEAIVLRKRSLSNQDKIITLLTLNNGKINVLAKGIKKITSRRLSNTETGNLISVVLHKRNDFFYLGETTLTSSFSRIKTDPKKTKQMYLIFFILERLLPDNQEELHIYSLCKRFLINLSERQRTEAELDRLINNILQNLGYINDNIPHSLLIKSIEEIISEKIPRVII